MRLRLSYLITTTLLTGALSACVDDGDTNQSDAGSLNASKPPSDRDAAGPAHSESTSQPAPSSETGSGAGPTETAPSNGNTSTGEPSNGIPTGREDGTSTSAPSSSIDSTGGDNTEAILPDLTISAAVLAPGGFTTVEVPESSCEIQDGCFGGGGARTVIPFELTIRNTGDAPLEVGRPWENGLFHLSACALQYRASNFVKAEVLGASGNVLAISHLPTSCIADEQSTSFTCTIQGLDIGESSRQLANTCSGLDVTGLAPGAYSVRLTINPENSFQESNFDNNSVVVELDKPECEGRFCGGVCCPNSVTCEDNQCQLPDLRANQDAVERSLIISKQTFAENACELEEMCITGPGKRRLLQFEGRIENVGLGAVNPGPERNNPLFEYSACHDHHHFLDFTDYKLLTADGSVAVQGHKQSFCLISMEPVEDYVSPVLGEVVHPEPGPTGCNYLEAGWADIYSVGTPCQWVDVTDVPPGDYILQVAVNPAGRIAESNVENNMVQVPVHIPADAPCQDQEVCGDVADQDCDGMPDASDPDCRDSALCCGEEDRCHLEHNRQCDCGGEPEWEHHDCEYAAPDGGYLGGECCSADDTCNWANDGVCDCNGDFEWDTRDCERVDDFCCEISAEVGFDICGLSFNGRCDCGSSGYSWDYHDCSNPPVPDFDGGVSPVDECCTPANTCDYANDDVCDCNGNFSWDVADCAMTSDETY